VPIVLKSGSLKLLEPFGLVQACNGITLSLYYSLRSRYHSCEVGVTREIYFTRCEVGITRCKVNVTREVGATYFELGIINCGVNILLSRCR